MDPRMPKLAPSPRRPNMFFLCAIALRTCAQRSHALGRSTGGQAEIPRKMDATRSPVDEKNRRARLEVRRGSRC